MERAGSSFVNDGVGILALVMVVGACRSEDPAVARGIDAAADVASACGALFGTPNAHTGLDDSQCRPSCGCGASQWTPPRYDDAFVQGLLRWRLSTPFASLTSDPYLQPPPPPDPDGTVCAVLPDGADDAGVPTYHMETYSSESSARAAGGIPTHFGRCGVCSTLGNLAVYVRESDLTAPVRDCGIRGINEGMAANLSCLRALGFDEPCAQIWYFNTVHTRTACLVPCVAALSQPYHLPDGGLNACIRCDEDQSGPVFKAVAGRTRRNSGLPNALCRPCAEVRPLVHAYP